MSVESGDLFAFLPVELIEEIFLYLIDSDSENIRLVSKYYKTIINKLKLEHGIIIIFTKMNLIKYINVCPFTITSIIIGKYHSDESTKYDRIQDDYNPSRIWYKLNNNERHICDSSSIYNEYVSYKYYPYKCEFSTDKIYLPDSLTIESFLPYRYRTNTNFVSKSITKTYNYYVNCINNDSTIINKTSKLDWYKKKFYSCNCHNDK